MARRFIGKGLFIITLFFSIFSCLPRPEEKVLDPGIVFGPGSSFLANATSIALKGELIYRNKIEEEAASFELYLAGQDSVLLFIKGTLGAEILKLNVHSDSAWLKIRGRDNSEIYVKGQTIALDDLGISDISPFIIGFAIFPQYYRKEMPPDFDYISDTLQIREMSFLVNPRTSKFVFRGIDSDLSISYSGRKEVTEGHYPSLVNISNLSGDWEIAVRITRVKINKGLSPDFWQLF